MTASKVATDMRIFHLSGPPKNGPQTKLRTQIPNTPRTEMVIRVVVEPLGQIRVQIPKPAKTKIVATNSGHFRSVIKPLTRAYQTQGQEDECESQGRGCSHHSLKIALVLVRLDHIASVIKNANQSIM